jgi:hypothetical protein
MSCLDKVCAIVVAGWLHAAELGQFDGALASPSMVRPLSDKG